MSPPLTVASTTCLHAWQVDPERLALHLHNQSKPAAEHRTHQSLKETSDRTRRREQRRQERKGKERDYSGVRGQEGELWHSDYGDD